MTPDQQPEPQPSPAPQPQTSQPAVSAITPPSAAETSPSESAPSQQPAPANNPVKPAAPSGLWNNSLVVTVAIAAVVFLLIAAGAVMAYQLSRNKAATTPTGTQVRADAAAPESPGPSNCMPVAAASLTKPVAETAFRSFIKAVVAQNQTCADDLSSSFFLGQAKDEFGTADGKWITATPQGLRPIWKDLAQLPPTFNDSVFTQAAYTRPIVVSQSSSGLKSESSSSSERPGGVKLSYPVDLSKYTGSTTEKWQVSVSFVAQSGKILVDDLVVEPQK